MIKFLKLYKKPQVCRIGLSFFCFDFIFLRCNTSSVGILRYSLKGLQLCTKVGWRNIVLEDDPPRCSDLNVPERNFEAFLKGNPGIMFQFNGNITPLINPSDYNSTITPGLSSIYVYISNI